MKKAVKKKPAKKRVTPKKKFAKKKAAPKKAEVKTKAGGKKTTGGKTAGALKKQVRGKLSRRVSNHPQYSKRRLQLGCPQFRRCKKN